VVQRGISADHRLTAVTGDVTAAANSALCDHLSLDATISGHSPCSPDDTLRCSDAASGVGPQDNRNQIFAYSFPMAVAAIAPTLCVWHDQLGLWWRCGSV
jgi:hypothetical protein